MRRSTRSYGSWLIINCLTLSLSPLWDMRAQYLSPYIAGVIFVKNIFQKWYIVLITSFTNSRYNIIMAIQFSTCIHIHKVWNDLAREALHKIDRPRSKELYIYIKLSIVVSIFLYEKNKRNTPLRTFVKQRYSTRPPPLWWRNLHFCDFDCIPPHFSNQLRCSCRMQPFPVFIICWHIVFAGLHIQPSPLYQPCFYDVVSRVLSECHHLQFCHTRPQR